MLNYVGFEIDWPAQSSFAVAKLTDGSFVRVFRDRTEDRGQHIFAEIRNTDATILIKDFELTQGSEGVPAVPDVIPLNDGRFTGWARDYRRYSDGFCTWEEDRARRAGHGVWVGDCMAPWDWRRQ